MSGISLGSMQIGGLTAQNYQLEYQLLSPEEGGGRRKLTQADYDAAAASVKKTNETINAKIETKEVEDKQTQTRREQEQIEQLQSSQRQQLLDSLVAQMRTKK